MARLKDMPWLQDAAVSCHRLQNKHAVQRLKSETLPMIDDELCASTIGTRAFISLLALVLVRLSLIVLIVLILVLSLSVGRNFSKFRGRDVATPEVLTCLRHLFFHSYPSHLDADNFCHLF